MIVEPWKSTYESLGDRTPARLASRYGRAVGAFRCAIPAETIEPPQVHLISPMDSYPFEEMIIDFERPFRVDFWDFKNRKLRTKMYEPGQDIVIPEHIVHWLVNPHKGKLEFTVECAPHPWDGQRDEPEFENFGSLLKYAQQKGFYKELLKVDLDSVI